jgi:hypothetical protein
VAEVGEARREIGAAVHRHDERAGDRPSPECLDRIVEPPLVFGQRVALDHG